MSSNRFPRLLGGASHGLGHALIDRTIGGAVLGVRVRRHSRAHRVAFDVVILFELDLCRDLLTAALCLLSCCKLRLELGTCTVASTLDIGELCLKRVEFRLLLRPRLLLCLENLSLGSLPLLLAEEGNGLLHLVHQGSVARRGAAIGY